MVKLYFYATKDDYEDILNDEVIVKPDEKGIYLCTFNPTDYMKNDKHLEEFDEDDRALNNHIRLRGRRPRTNGGRLARLDHYIKFDIPFFDIHLCEGARGLYQVARKSKVTVTSETSTLIAMTGHRDDVRMLRKRANQVMKI